MQCKGITKKGLQCRLKQKSSEYCHYHIIRPQENKYDDNIKILITKPSPIVNTLEKYKEKECCVCLERFPDGFEPLKPCGHFIHLICVARTGKTTCPICRTELLLSKSTIQWIDNKNKENKIIEEEEERHHLLLDLQSGAFGFGGRSPQRQSQLIQSMFWVLEHR